MLGKEFSNDSLNESLNDSNESFDFENLSSNENNEVIDEKINSLNNKNNTSNKCKKRNVTYKKNKGKRNKNKTLTIEVDNEDNECSEIGSNFTNNFEVIDLQDSDNNSELEDSVEVIEEISNNICRRSARIKKKYGNNYSLNEDILLDYHSLPTYNKKPFNQQIKRKRKNVPLKNSSAEVNSKKSLNEIDNVKEEDLNPEVTVKVIWKSISVKKFKIRKFQKISKIHRELSKEENVPENKIILTFNGNKINDCDTPSSLNLQVFDFLEGGLIKESTNNSNSVTINTEYDNSSVLLKFQDSNKKVINLPLKKNDLIKSGMIRYAEQIEIPLEKIKFFFDGEVLDPLETPSSIDI
ncbi:asparagine-rich protein, putative [Pediculus humanus corporis]|uniref:Asparagine-rich protein, putative n=1 Tax=Pediculus humanus subsp. corporis TaxID=121224 RepID=E0VGX8_PEDHC|nr:asparagine-rich protein, putative [Pediculus humanus corporis]EEB12634.1 asparagine-rich protein, putative [Pediculus humanus corporis]